MNPASLQVARSAASLLAPQQLASLRSALAPDVGAVLSAASKELAAAAQERSLAVSLALVSPRWQALIK